MKLGTKVKCKGYLKKVNTHHVIPWFDKDKPIKELTEFDLYHDSEHDKIIEEDYSQIIKEIIKCDFEGVVVAKKEVAMERYFSIDTHPYTDEDFMRILNDKIIDCYQVFFRMGGSRLVPVDMCEVSNE